MPSAANNFVRLSIKSVWKPVALFLLFFAIWVDASGPGKGKNFYARREKQSDCKHPILGRDDVNDSAFKATSHYDGDLFRASAARLTREAGEINDMTAWCPRNMVGPELKEHIQISLPSMQVITVIETRGRFAQNTGKEFTPYFEIQYQREENDHWFTYHDINGEAIMKGNTDALTPNYLMLKPFIIAKRIRIFPYNQDKLQICLKLELYGCVFKDGVVEYEIPQGDSLGRTSYKDFTYDGITTGVGGELLSGGMGQLMDNIFFRFNAHRDPYQTGKAGYHFVGWRRNTRPNDRPISLLFRFDQVREFKGLRIHAANRYGKGIRIFRKAVLHFSVGGRYFWPENVVMQKYPRDESLQTSRWVTIDLQHKKGKWIKMELFFDDEWMLLSEIEFFSEPIKGTPPPPEESPTDPPPPTRGDNNRRPQLPMPAASTRQPELPGLRRDERPPYPPHVDQPMDPNFKHILIIIVALVAVLIFGGFIVFLIVCRRRRRRKKKDEPCYALTINGSSLHPGVDMPLVVMPAHNGRPPTLVASAMNGKAFNESSIYTSLPSEDDEEASAGAGAAGSDVTYATAGPPPPPPPMPGVVALPCKRRMSSDRTVLPPPPPCSTGVEYASASIFSTPPPPYSSSMYSASVGGPAAVVSPPMQIIPNPTAVILEGSYSRALASSPYKMKGPSAPPPPLPHYPPDMSIQGVSGNTVYAAPKELDAGSTNSAMSLDELGLTQVERTDLNFVDHLGGGQFGEVHLAEWTPKPTGKDNESLEVTRVAVKMLRTDASDQARRDFETEIRILSRLNNPNIVRVLGISNQGGNLLVLVEYMEFGDLNQYLRERYPSDEMMRLPGANAAGKMLSYGALIYIAVQVSSAMKYLESLSMVHRDLACRNCLVGHRLTIKISDFGMSRRLYASDYYRIEGKAILPIRWMAWESLLHGVFTPKSDVWSFGVTLWEILTYCQQQPYANLTDEEVIRNCGHMHAENGEAEYLPHPPNCPKEMYDLMHACWNKNECARPAFREIHLFLLKNNLGFKPEDYCSSLA